MSFAGPRLVTPVNGFVDSRIIDQPSHCLLQQLIVLARRKPPAVKRPGSQYHVRAVSPGPRCFLVDARPPGVEITGRERKPEIVKPPFIHRRRDSEPADVSVIELLCISDRVRSLPAWLVTLGAASIVGLGEACRGKLRGRICTPHGIDEELVDTRVLVGIDAILVRLIAVYVKTAGIRPGECKNFVVRPQAAELAVHSRVEGEVLGLDRARAEIPRPGHEELVERNVVRPRDTWGASTRAFCDGT